jgi:hypothetical protein
MSQYTLRNLIPLFEKGKEKPSPSNSPISSWVGGNCCPSGPWPSLGWASWPWCHSERCRTLSTLEAPSQLQPQPGQSRTASDALKVQAASRHFQKWPLRELSFGLGLLGLRSSHPRTTFSATSSETLPAGRPQILGRLSVSRPGTSASLWRTWLWDRDANSAPPLAWQTSVVQQVRGHLSDELGGLDGCLSRAALPFHGCRGTVVDILWRFPPCSWGASAVPTKVFVETVCNTMRIVKTHPFDL